MFLSKDWFEEREAKVAGRADGRDSHPPVDWTDGPVPFISQLHSRYNSSVSDMSIELLHMQGKSSEDVHDFAIQKRRAINELRQARNEISLVEKELDHALKEKAGSDSNSRSARAPREREIPTWLYALALVGLVIGEFLVTIPAARLALGDKPVATPFGEVEPIFWVTLSIAILSITAAHIFGLTIKGQLDRDRPHSKGVSIGVIALAISLVVTVLFLSAMRAQNVATENTLFLGNDGFGTILFFMLQLTFIGVATWLAFFNHSELDTRINRIKKRLSDLNDNESDLLDETWDMPEGVLTPEKRLIRSRILKEEYTTLKNRYMTVAEIYVRHNLRYQPDQRTTRGPGLSPAPLDLIDFEGIERDLVRRRPTDELLEPKFFSNELLPPDYDNSGRSSDDFSTIDNHVGEEHSVFYNPVISSDSD
jgi:hypothetical protein